MNVTFMLVDIFGLRPSPSQKATSSGAQKYNKPTLRALIEVEREFNDILVAFHEVYCVAFEMLDNQWLEQKASYLQFNGKSSTSIENVFVVGCNVSVYPRRRRSRGLVLYAASGIRPLTDSPATYLPLVRRSRKTLRSFLSLTDVLKNTKENLERALSNQSVKCVSDLRRVSGCIY